jgi:hypothetical protein
MSLFSSKFSSMWETTRGIFREKEFLQEQEEYWAHFSQNYKFVTLAKNEQMVLKSML